MNQSFDLKQPVATTMALGHTREVRLESGTIQSIIFCIQGIEDMRQRRTAILTIFHKNHTDFSLHCQTAIDINPIVKIIVTGPDQRHCSTTFYQIIPLVKTTGSAVSKNVGKSNSHAFFMGGTI